MNQNNDVVQEIKSKNDIVDVVSEYLLLEQRGRNFLGVCPFHNDNHPSMSVSREKQIFNCFACGTKGNVFNFVMKKENITFKEALAKLAKRVGINYQYSKNQEVSEQHQELFDAYKLASKYYQNNLASSIAVKAKQYLHDRKINDDLMKEFEVGLSLGTKDDLTTLLTNKNYNLTTLNQLGLSNGEHDAFINRIVFPLYDIQGRIVGFSGRIYEKSNLNKYLNTKETPIFKKGMTIYHYHVAKEEARVKNSIIVMEGFMDVIRASSIGYRNTVALMGTAMTSEQANLLKRLSNNIILCFDGDNAGCKATLANGNQLEELGLAPKVIALPKEDDPDTFILTYGKERFDALVDNAIYFSDYKLDLLKQGVDFQSDLEKTSYIHQMLLELSKIKDEIRCEIILKRLAKECDIGYNTLDKRLQEMKKQEGKRNSIDFSLASNSSNAKNKIEKNKFQKAMQNMINYMLVDEKAIQLYEEEKQVFPDEDYRILAEEIAYYYHMHGKISVSDFYTYALENEKLQKTLDLAVDDVIMELVTKQGIIDCLKVIQEYRLNQEIKRLTSKMEKEVDPLEQAKIAKEIIELRNKER